MDPASLAVFAAALFVYAFMPGPNTAVISARTLAGDLGAATVFCVGLIWGHAALLSLIYAGLAVWLQSNTTLMTTLKWASVAYIAWVASEMWRKPVVRAGTLVLPSARRTAPLVCMGFLSSATNPQLLLFYAVMLPGVQALDQISLATYCQITALALIVLAATYGIVAGLAAHLRRFVASPARLFVMNRFAAALMAFAALWVATG